MAGYSTTPLAKKLGIKAGFNCLLYQAPNHYLSLFADLPEDISFVDGGDQASVDFIHIFCTYMEDLTLAVEKLKPLLKKSGLLWVSWPKGSSSIPTDLKRDPIRDYLLDQGLVDTKVAAVDADWSGLKFVYRLKDR